MQATLSTCSLGQACIKGLQDLKASSIVQLVLSHLDLATMPVIVALERVKQEQVSWFANTILWDLEADASI